MRMLSGAYRALLSTKKKAASASIALTNAQFTEGDAQGTTIGTLSVVSGTGTYAFTLTDTHNYTQLNADGVTLEVGPVAASAGTSSISVTADNGAGSVVTRSITIYTVFAAPSFTWTSAANDNTPNFDVGIPASAIAGDVLHINYSADSGVTWTDYVLHTLTSGDLTSGTIAATALTTIPDGTGYLFRTRIERASPVLNGAWCSNVTVNIDTVAPTLSSPTAAQNGTDNTLADLSVTSNEASGTLYWIVTTDNSATPTAAQIEAGQDQSGTSTNVMAHSSLTPISGVNSFQATISASNTYYLYAVQVDAATNVSNIVSASWTQTIVAFNPTSLFPANGAYYNVDRAVADGKIFQADGITPAIVGGAVGKLWDYSGNNNHLLQTTTAFCPILRNSGSEYWLEFNGISQYLRATFTLGSPKTEVVALQQVSWTANDFLWDGVSGAESSITQDGTGVSPNLRMRVAGTGGFSFAGPPVGTNAVITMIMNGALSKATVNNAAYTTGSTGTNDALGLTLGARQSTANFSNILFFGGIFWSDGSTLLSDLHIADCRTFFGNLAGLSL